MAQPPIARRLSLGLGVGLLLSVLLVGLILGYRPDMATASLTTMFWVKLGYVSGIGAVALWAVRPVSTSQSCAVRCIHVPTFDTSEPIAHTR